MAIPLYKIGFTAYKLASKPLVSIMVRAIKNRGRNSLFSIYFENFGQVMHRFERKVDNFVARASLEDQITNEGADSTGGSVPGSGLVTPPDKTTPLKVMIRPISRDAAFHKGVEYFCEFFILYSSLFFICIYEIKKSWSSEQAKAAKLSDLEHQADNQKVKIEVLQKKLKAVQETKSMQI